MKNKLLLLYIITLPNLIFAQNKDMDEECSCSVLLLEKQKKIALFDDNGTAIHYIMNDTINEDYFVMNIKIIKHNLAFVEASAILYDTISKFGWIEIQHLGIHFANWTDVKLYSRPNKKSKIKSVIIKPEWVPLNILKCKGRWLYISYLDGDSTIKEGWLPPDNQCANPYTTCN